MNLLRFGLRLYHLVNHKLRRYIGRSYKRDKLPRLTKPHNYTLQITDMIGAYYEYKQNMTFAWSPCLSQYPTSQCLYTIVYSMSLLPVISIILYGDTSVRAAGLSCPVFNPLSDSKLPFCISLSVNFPLCITPAAIVHDIRFVVRN